MAERALFDKIELHLVRVLHTVITERSVPRAALKLGSTQPTVSAQLKRLRSLTGEPLLVRSGATLMPTEAALQLVAGGAAAAAPTRCSARAIAAECSMRHTATPRCASPPATTSTRCSCPNWWRACANRRPAFASFEKSRSGQAEFFANRFGTQANTSSANTTTDTGENAGTQQGTDINDPSRSGTKFADADLVRELAELTRAANRANATIYTIDPRGLVGMPDLDDNVDPVEFQEYLSNSINSLRVLAEQTGGIAVVNQNDFDKALKRIDAETSDYYMIGYYSTNPDPLKRTRQIDVKVKRKDVDVWARKSYSIKTGPRK